MPNANITYVGMDVHKKDISVCLLDRETGAPIEWRARNEPQEVRRMARRLKRRSGESELYCVYEAGPCGYALQRELREAGISTEGSKQKRVAVYGSA